MNSNITRLKLKQIGGGDVNFTISRKDNESDEDFELRGHMTAHQIPGHIVEKVRSSHREETWFFVMLPDNNGQTPSLSVRERKLLESLGKPIPVESALVNALKDSAICIILDVEMLGSFTCVLPPVFWNSRFESEEEFHLKAENALYKLGWQVTSRGYWETKQQAYWTVSRIPDGCGG